MADQTEREATAFGNVARWPKVQGKCPACGRNSLFLGSGGYVTCAIIGCSKPDAATDVLARTPTPHVVTTVGELRALPSRTAIMDKTGDVGVIGVGGIYYPETRVVTLDYAAKHWGPFTVLTPAPAPSEEAPAGVREAEKVWRAANGQPMTAPAPADREALEYRVATRLVQLAKDGDNLLNDAYDDDWDDLHDASLTVDWVVNGAVKRIDGDPMVIARAVLDAIEGVSHG